MSYDVDTGCSVSIQQHARECCVHDDYLCFVIELCEKTQRLL